MKQHFDSSHALQRVAKWNRCGKAPLLAVLLIVSVSSAWAKLPGEKMTAAGIRRSTSRYVKMRDGVEIAVSVWLPSDLQDGERVPVLMKTTRYWREPQFNWPLRTLAAVHLVPQHFFLDGQVSYYNARHFAVVLADARGSGASGGRRNSSGRMVAWAHSEFRTKATRQNLRQCLTSPRLRRSYRSSMHSITGRILVQAE